ncbi:DNA-directed RNA polymerase subunit alpha C-terminal domain-containing protein [Candidatus Nasuia deltocephalinicola]|uniref:DNA-directed RNA polymerase subunit alpha C-terminal domain-containing protein n=1 Tax=Candidatus Nasuia deltocephalincola TaxID=1160784 RepID=UPI00216B070F|nr:DNA-directed RNA polymerase subunit alpha C-terminal domain-containing protein [Candidatus Nasuia deltocephalinicola]
MDKIYFDYIELISLNFYKVVFKPFICDSLFINVIANAIRHSLFINTYGYAVTEIKIFNVNNEFGYIFGLKEDLLNLILNIKSLIFKLKKKKKTFVRLFSDKNVVKGKHVVLNKYTKILNPNHIIANLNSGFSIDLILKIEKGKGYIPFSSDKKYKNSSNLKNSLLVDAYFCPILRVSYSINRIEDLFYNNIYKIVFFVETNGLISAKKAIINSIISFMYTFSNFKFLKKKNISNFSLFNNYNNYLFISIIDSGLTFRTCKHLINLGVLYINDLIKFDRSDIINIFFFSKKTLLEIMTILKKYNLFLLY